MNRPGRVLVGATVLILAVLSTVAGIPQEPEERVTVAKTLRSFELADQYGRIHKCEFPCSMVSIFLVADRQGSEQIQPWVQAIKRRYASTVLIRGIADVSSAPSFLHVLVRDRFKDKFRYPILLDWDARIVGQFAPSKGVANTYLVDRNGRILLALQGNPDRTGLERLFAAVDAQRRP